MALVGKLPMPTTSSEKVVTDVKRTALCQKNGQMEKSEKVYAESHSEQKQFFRFNLIFICAVSGLPVGLFSNQKSQLG
jgi:hypothetical protein